MLDVIPSLPQQLGELGKVTESAYPSGRHDRIVRTNPSIIHLGQDILLVERLDAIRSGSPTREWRRNSSQLRIWLINKVSRHRQILNTISPRDELGGLRSHEDPRLNLRGDSLEIWCASRSLAHQTGPIRQEILRLNKSLDVEHIVVPTHFGNDSVPYQKNWSPVAGSDKFVYWLNGKHIVSDLFDQTKTYESKGLSWEFGEIHLGTPSLQMGGTFLAFFQSSREDDFLKTQTESGAYNSRYFLGAYEFSAIPPYEILRWTPNPLLIGSLNNPHRTGSPACLFPSGMIIEEDNILLSLGINHAGWAIVRFDRKALVSRLERFN